MWASMQALTRPSTTTATNARSNPRNKLDWAPRSASSILTSPSLFSPASPSSLPQSGKNKEIQALARWLDSSPQEDPWAERTTEISTSPTDALDSGFESRGKEKELKQDIGGREKERLGFEDDFTVFVSAPPSTDPDISTASFTADGEETEETKDGVLSVGTLYTALKSVEDLSLTEGTPRHDVADDEDEGMPTKDEIRQTAGIIFGAKASSAAPSEGPLGRKSLDLEDDNNDRTDDLGLGDPDADFSSFDLPRVFSALQGMKAEIAAMTDPEEKRRAAAKVALGLVYGLERED